jgi:hypothetical protein
MDAFFEPHVREWLKTTEEVETYEWVTRAVGMDSVSSPVSFSTRAARTQQKAKAKFPQWVPEGNLRHSQSVLDLFEFIRRACQTVLHELPLRPYKRACYLIDLSKVSHSIMEDGVCEELMNYTSPL